MTSADPTGGEVEARPSASIVIPVHNKATITRQCLDALLAEADDGVAREIVVVDDGSTDLTASILASYGDRIRVVRHETAQGFARACNAGFAAASGEFVVLLNNDTIPTTGWLAALVAHARGNPNAAVVGAKLLFPNDTVQHAGVVFGLDALPHHIYAGFPADHPATTVSRRYQVVTAACALFRRSPWQELDGLDTSYRNGWEDVDYCLRAGQAGYEVHFCAHSVVYHLESATRDLFSPAERANRDLFVSRWKDAIVPDDFGYYWVDGLLAATYGARYPFKLSVSPLLAGVTIGEHDRLADRLLFDRSRQVMILLRNNIVLNVRVQEAEARAADAERRLAAAEARLAAPGASTHDPPPLSHDESSDTVSEPDEQPPAAPEQTAAEPDPTPAPLPHRIVGMVESPGRLPDVITDGVLVVSGWTLTDSGQARIEVIVNGETRGEIPYGDPRSDAAALYPGFPAGENCGFAGEIAVADLPDGLHDVTIRIHATEDSHATLSTTFEIDNHAFETGRVIGRFDQPVRGAIFLAREIAPVSGWVLSPSGIRSLNVTIDGEPRGRVDYGALRPDIAKRRRQYPDADHCGFSGSVPLFGLPAGSHELAVLVTANDGQQLELSTRIEIEGTESIDAGLPVINRHYPAWLEKRAANQDRLAAVLLPDPVPAFELIVPISGDCEDAVLALWQSLTAQTETHPAWRLTFVAIDAPSQGTASLLRELTAASDRISYRAPSGTGADNLNDALSTSDAGWVALVAPGTLFAPDVLTRIAVAVGDRPDANLVYVDDDRVDPELAVRWNPFFKPDWSPDLLLAMNYLGPLVLFRRETALAAGGIRPGFSNAETYDLALRVSEAPGEIVHVPEVLATRIESAPLPDQPWHASDWKPAEQQAIADALDRRGVAATVEPGLHPGLWRVRYALETLPTITAVIPTGGKLHLLRPCLDDLLERTDYPNLEILLVDNSSENAVAELVAELTPHHPNVRRIVDDRKPFNFPGLINNAVAQVTTPYVLMLNDDITVIDPGWLRAMMEHAQRPEVGVVGAKLLYPDDTIQHAGVVLGPFGGSVHVFKRLPGADPGYFDLPDAVRNCSAVTFACALIDRALFERLGGMDAEHFPVAFNDVDFCLRAREAGYEVIYTPHATLYHHESVTKTVIAHPHEIGYLRSRWGHVIDHDPYYNPNLTRSGEDARLNMSMTMTVPVDPGRAA
jgi:O-antigen biosynthesis protein